MAVNEKSRLSQAGIFITVEATGIEPVSKHDVQKLSTCLVLH